MAPCGMLAVSTAPTRNDLSRRLFSVLSKGARRDIYFPRAFE